jgi:hypothetical protein
MTLDAARERVVGRYRVMFKTSLIALAFSVALMIGGFLVAASSAGSLSLFGFGMFLTALSALNAYRILTSTVKILDAHPEERMAVVAGLRRGSHR